MYDILCLVTALVQEFVALSCTFFDQRHCASQKEVDLCRNEDQYADFVLRYICLFTEEEEKMMGKSVLAISLMSLQWYILPPLRVLSCL